MNLSASKQHLLFIGLGAIVLAALVVVLLSRGADDDSSHLAGASSPAEAPPLEAWPDDEAADMIVRVDSRRGPLLEIGDAGPVALTPGLDDVDFTSWEILRGEDNSHVVGTGDADGVAARAVWTFVDGNPQAHLHLSLVDLDAAKLADDFGLTLPLPPGDLTSQPPVEARPAGVAASARWSSGQQTLTFSNWSGSQLLTRSGAADNPSLEMILWTPEHNSAWAGCARQGDGRAVSVTASLTVTVGTGPATARWALPRANRALLVPVFDEPAHHGDGAFADTGARSAQRWLSRARTLVYGHSDPGDPRYGNGGLLGHGLGGALVVPEAFSSDSQIHDFAAELAETPVELIPRTATDSEHWRHHSRLIDGADCQTLLATGDGRPPVIVAGFVGDARSDASLQWRPGTDLTTPAAAVQLDGSRPTLLGAGLSVGLTDRLVEQGSTLVFTSPFVATRNPLIPAAKAGLLDPERNGRWTLAAPLSKALADLELHRESSPFLVTKLATAAEHPAAVRRVQVWWDHNGDLLVYNPAENMLDEFTLAVAGDLQARPARENAEIDRHSAERATLLSWDLPPGTERMSTGDAQPPPAVRWRLEQ